MVGLLIADEASFVSGIPVPALVLFRYLRHWGEIAYYVPGTKERDRGPTFLLSYTINSFKALVQSVRTDTSTLSYCLSNIAVLTYLQYRESCYYEDQDNRGELDLNTLLADIDDYTPTALTTTSATNTPKAGRERQSVTGSLSASEERLEDIERRERLKKEREFIVIAKLDSSSMNTFFIANEHFISPKKRPSGISAIRKDSAATLADSAANNETPSGSPADMRDILSVDWFDEQLRMILATAYAQLLNNICNTEFKKTLEGAIFSKSKKTSAASSPSQQPRSTKNNNNTTTPLKTSSSGVPGGKSEDDVHMDKVVATLSDYLSELQMNFIHFGLITQFFMQVFRFIDAVLFDILLLRKDFCTLSRGEEIVKKLRRLEDWTKEAGAEWVGQSFDCLKHVRQAAKVLVMSEKGKRQLCESAAAREKECPSLNVWQLRQLLTMYTPDEGEQKLSLSVLSKLFSSTSTNEEEVEEDAVMLDVSHVEPLVGKELHYIELEDAMSLPFPPAVKKKLKDMMPHKGDNTHHHHHGSGAQEYAAAATSPRGLRGKRNRNKSDPPLLNKRHSDLANSQSAQKVIEAIWGKDNPQ